MVEPGALLALSQTIEYKLVGLRSGKGGDKGNSFIFPQCKAVNLATRNDTILRRYNECPVL
jgi:hypothetical protein